MGIFVKLGETASMFYDPTTRVKVMPNAAVEVSNTERKSKKFKRALAGGHLSQISKEEAIKYNARADKKAAKANAKLDGKPNKIGDAPAADKETDILKMKKDELVEYAVEKDFGTQEEMDE